MFKGQDIIKENINENSEKAFLSYMSHRIRTPLNSIIGFSKLLLNQDIDAQKNKEFARRILESGYEILQYFENILDLADMETGMVIPNSREITLSQFLSGIVEEYSTRFQIDKSVHIKMTNLQEHSAKSVFVDEFILKRIVTNMIELLQNALKDGEIVIRYAVEDDLIRIDVEGRAQLTEQNDFLVLDDTMQSYDQDSLEYLAYRAVKELTHILHGEFKIEKQYKRGIGLRVLIPQQL